ncbi:hypothetical protein UH38_23410 [Aliterella atlantica CENA595]|uniref:Uncharacterized protein n=1 Tax=Aliterella atlantica CENA595 TaxID=1618023 RepID=A0A0D8ZQL6_9CYAN|nr:hypothetical protein UH38_23410 [Aliterella atlantica CENA595]
MTFLAPYFVVTKRESIMQEISFATKQRSLSQLQYYKAHYQRLYPQAKHQGKIILRHHLKKLNAQIERQQDESVDNS